MPRPRRALVVLGIVVLAYVAEVRSDLMPIAVHGDGYYTYLWARTMVYDHDVSFANDYRLCGDPWGLEHAPIGEDVNYWNLGPALFWVPILAFDRVTHHAALDDPDPLVRNACRGTLAERGVKGSLVAGLLTLWLGFLVARRYAGDGPALFGMVAIAFLSSLPYYSTQLLSYGHAASAFGCALSVWAWERARRRSTTRGWAVLGASVGLAMLMRTQNVVLVVPILATWLVQARGLVTGPWRALGRHVLRGMLFTLLLLLVFLPQLDFWHSQSGKWLMLSQGEHYMRWGQPRLLGVLFSQGGGLFVWQPVTYLAFAGMVVLACKRQTRGLGLALLALFALDTYTVASVYDWWSSIGYPGRRFDMLLLPEVVGCAALGAALLRAGRRRPGMLPTAFVAGMMLLLGVWNVGTQGGVAYGMRSDRPVPAEMRWNEVFTKISTPFWRTFGDPLAYPASIPFALRYGVHPREWDVVGGPEFFYHEHQTLSRLHDESILHFDDPVHAHYLVGFRDLPETASSLRVRVLVGSRGRILLPLHWPDAGALSLRGAPLGDQAAWVALRIGNVYLDAKRYQPHVPTTWRYELPPGASHGGINEIFVKVRGGQMGFETMEIMDPDPPPTVRQAARNREVAAAQAAWRRSMGLAPPP